MTSYVSVEELKQSLELQGTLFANLDVERAIGAASRAIDSYCGRRFDKDTTDTIRYYTLEHSIVQIDDLADTPSEVAVATSAGTYTVVGVEGTDFTVEPFNAAANSEPYNVLRALTWWPTYSCRWSKIRPNLRVTGPHGWPAVPSQIPQAAGILAAKLLVRARQAPFGVVTAGADVGVAIRIARTDPDVAFLLDGLRRDILYV